MILTAAALAALPSASHADAERGSDRAVWSLPMTQTFVSDRPSSQYNQLAATNISRSQAKAIALRAHRGAEYIDMKLVGGNVWAVVLMQQGRRFKVHVDARTGRIVG